MDKENLQKLLEDEHTKILSDLGEAALRIFGNKERDLTEWYLIINTFVVELFNGIISSLNIPVPDKKRIISYNLKLIREKLYELAENQEMEIMDQPVKFKKNIDKTQQEKEVVDEKQKKKGSPGKNSSFDKKN